MELSYMLKAFFVFFNLLFLSRLVVSKYVMKMSREEIQSSKTIDAMGNIFFIFLLINVAMSMLSNFLNESSSIYQYFYSAQYNTSVTNILDLIYFPSMYIIYIAMIKTGVISFSLKDDWKEIIGWFMLAGIIYLTGSVITDKVVPSLSTLTVERITAFFYRYAWSRIFLFTPFLFYKKLSFKFKKVYLNIIMANVILHAFVVIYLRVHYSDFLSNYINLTIEFFFIVFTHIPSMIRLMYDIGHEEMKKMQERNFQVILITLIVIMFSMPFAFELVDSLVEQQLDFAAIVSMSVFSFILMALIASASKLIKKTISQENKNVG